ncbi:MAG: 4-(cytidine 5'-diphospho)-2-C-methyl-D-erythritol kinase, partial [Candidatus Binatia bacterium]
AAVLKSLNTLFSLELTEVRLCALAAHLGADVPFFIPCRPMRVGGIGEVLTATPPLPARWLVIVIPPFGVSTPWAYRRFDELEAISLPSPQPSPLQGEGEKLSLFSLVNDLERAVLPQYPLIGQLKDHLLHLGAEGALMSGSGSAVFGVFQNLATAEQAMTALREQGQTFLVKTLAGPPVDFAQERC